LISESGVSSQALWTPSVQAVIPMRWRSGRPLAPRSGTGIIDRASGKLRPELSKALLSANRAGDQLVVTKLDRSRR
jgi:hypothetical protein